MNTLNTAVVHTTIYNGKHTHIVQIYMYCTVQTSIIFSFKINRTAHTHTDQHFIIYFRGAPIIIRTHNGVFMIAIDYNYILITGSLYSSHNNNNSSEIQCCTDVNDCEIRIKKINKTKIPEINDEKRRKKEK